MKYSIVEEFYSNLFQSNEMYDFRNDLHMHPEIGGEEFRTVEKICEKMDEYGLSYEHVADTGLVVRIKGNRPGKTIGIRADIDALPIDDESDFEFKSQIPGRNHACGHDIHCACLVGVAKMLASLKGDFAGNIVLLFQPAEESFGGADRMIKDGALENPHVDHVIGFHNSQGSFPGEAEIRYGSMYAGSDGFRMVVHGKSAHAAYPGSSIDPIVCASQIVLACQTIVSRNVSPTNSAVVTFGVIQGGVVQNQIPDSVLLRGTCRTLDPETRELAIRRVREVAEGVCEAMGATLEFERIPSYPPLVNDDKVVDVVKSVLVEAIGSDKVHEIHESEMGCEDFAYFAAARPSCYYHLGDRPADRQVFGAHNTKYNPDAEHAIPYGIKFHTAIALTLAGN